MKTIIKNDLETTPEGKLVERIFGFTPAGHPYFICTNCGKDYYEFHPNFCYRCGYAGGAIINPSLKSIARVLRRVTKIDARSRNKNITNELERLEKRIQFKLAMLDSRIQRYGDLKLAAENLIDEQKRRFKRNPCHLGLILCALAERMK